MNQSLDEAQTECESMDGHLVEIDNEKELNYLERLWKNDPWLLSNGFQMRPLLLGTKKDLETGLWHWEKSGRMVNMALFTKSDPGSQGEVRAFAQDFLSEFQPTNEGPETEFPIVICETPSKFASKYPPSKPSFDDRFIPFQLKDTASYLLSGFELPWKAAQIKCEEKGGWLAEVLSPEINRELKLKFDVRSEIPYLGSRHGHWLGAKSTDGEWRWHHTNKSFAGAFTDWAPNYDLMVDDHCLLLLHSWNSWKEWAHFSCTEWKHFICELPQKDGDAKAPEAKESDLVSAKKCLKGQKADGKLSPDGNGDLSDNCYRFVQLQYTRSKAEEFCRENFDGSLAVVESAHRKEFDAWLMEENSSGYVNRASIQNHEKVSLSSRWWMNLAPKVSVTTQKVAGYSTDLILVEGTPICYPAYSGHWEEVAYATICRHLGYKKYEARDNMTIPVERYEEIVGQPYSGEFIHLNCDYTMENLDNCQQIRDPCPYNSALLLQCADETATATAAPTGVEGSAEAAPTNTTDCSIVHVSSNELRASEINCDRLNWFVCAV